MLKIPYQAINNSQDRKEFDLYIKHLNVPLIDYIAIGVQDLVNKKSTSLKSDCNFQKVFVDLELAEYDPIRQALWQANTSFLTFDSVPHGDRMGKTVMNYRQKYHINNGIVCMEKTLTERYILTLATGYKKFDGYKFLVENKRAISSVFFDLKEIINVALQEKKIKNLDANIE